MKFPLRPTAVLADTCHTRGGPRPVGLTAAVAALLLLGGCSGAGGAGGSDSSGLGSESALADTVVVGPTATTPEPSPSATTGPELVGQLRDYAALYERYSALAQEPVNTGDLDTDRPAMLEFWKNAGMENGFQLDAILMSQLEKNYTDPSVLTQTGALGPIYGPNSSGANNLEIFINAMYQNRNNSDFLDSPDTYYETDSYSELGRHLISGGRNNHSTWKNAIIDESLQFMNDVASAHQGKDIVFEVCPAIASSNDIGETDEICAYTYTITPEDGSEPRAGYGRSGTWYETAADGSLDNGDITNDPDAIYVASGPDAADGTFKGNLDVTLHTRLTAVDAETGELIDTTRFATESQISTIKWLNESGMSQYRAFVHDPLGPGEDVVVYVPGYPEGNPLHGSLTDELE